MSIHKLIRRISHEGGTVLPPRAELMPPGCPASLKPLYEATSGILGFGGALRIFPLFGGSNGVSKWTCEHWNREDLWKVNCSQTVRRTWFFGEDAFGWQFGVSDDAYVVFNPEEEEPKVVAHSADAWAAWVLADPDATTGRAALAAFERRNGRLSVDERLWPIVPLVASGNVKPDNLRAADGLEAVKSLICFCNRICDLPDGTWVRLGDE